MSLKARVIFWNRGTFDLNAHGCLHLFQIWQRLQPQPDTDQNVGIMSFVYTLFIPGKQKAPQLQ